MAKKSIFIGSASESKELAATIARALADAGFEPLRWWQVFPPGSVTLDRLNQIAEKVDGAVFVFTSVDKTWYREELSSSPRDNVVLEYGLFVAHLGRERTLLLKDQEARLPSDINAITYEKIIEDSSTVAERSVRHFEVHFSDSLPPSLDAIPVVADPNVIEQQMKDPLPSSWHNRDLYFGIEGARGWLATVNESTYAPASQEVKLRRMLFEAVRDIEVRTMVSLGPGNADTDCELAIRLRNREPWLQYIPVDISDGLLQVAVNTLSNQVRVPVGILCDFEDRLNFIQRQLRVYSIPPTLFCLLGNTLGDLDQYEGTFVSTLSTMMRPDDHFLLDISLAGPKWSREKDRRSSPKGFGPAYRRFIATGIARRTYESEESIVERFEQRLQIRDGDSDVPNTHSLALYDMVSDRRVCTILRYDWESFLAWIQNEMKFKVVYKCASFFDEDVLGDGVLLLKRP